MRKNFILILSIFLLFGFCKKSGTESESAEDDITIEITVLENGTPKAGIYVIVYALVKQYTMSRVEGSQTQGDFYTTTQENTVLTNVYGKSIFKYHDMSVPDRSGIVVEKIELKYMNNIVLEDPEEKLIEKNGSLELEYDIGG